MIALRVTVTGRVQGVGFRASAQRTGAQLGLTGWVRNTPDGSVEMHVQGPAENVEEFVVWCHRGPTAAHIEDVSAETSPVDPAMSGFVRR